MTASNQNKLLDLFDAYATERVRPTPLELGQVAFELAYQVRVAIEKIRFAIRQINSSAGIGPEAMEASLQLADALDRLSSADRKFSRAGRTCDNARETTGIRDAG